MVERRPLRSADPQSRAEQLARIDSKLRQLNESREATTNERVRQILDARLSDLAARRDAIEDEAGS
jgi:hypothetical protein